MMRNGSSGLFNHRTKSSNGVGVILTRPRRGSTGFGVSFLDADDRAVRSRDKEVGSTDEDEKVATNKEVPLQSTGLWLPVVEQPHASHWMKTHQGSEQGTNQRDKLAEDGDAACNAVGNDSHRQSATKPGSPVNPGVGGEVLRVPESSNEDVLGGQLFSWSARCLDEVQQAMLLTWM